MNDSNLRSAAQSAIVTLLDTARTTSAALASRNILGAAAIDLQTALLPEASPLVLRDAARALELAQVAKPGRVQNLQRLADDIEASAIEERAGQIVAGDVRLGISWLVSELFKKAYEPESIMDESEAEALAGRPADADDMHDQLPAGYTVESGIDPSDMQTAWRWFPDEIPADDLAGLDWFETEGQALTDLFENGLKYEATGCEAFEHWAVSPWLADKLREKGESVANTDWAGDVWARCTSGQMIRMDYVIQSIARDLETHRGSEACKPDDLERVAAALKASTGETGVGVQAKARKQWEALTAIRTGYSSPAARAFAEACKGAWAFDPRIEGVS